MVLFSLEVRRTIAGFTMSRITKIFTRVLWEYGKTLQQFLA